MQISPLIKLAICLILGIFLKQVVQISPPLFPTLWGLCILFIVLILLIKQKYRSQLYRFGLPACVFMLFLGFFRTTQLNESQNDALFSKKDYTSLQAKIIEVPAVREKSVKAVLQVLSGKDSVGFFPCMGKIMAYFAVDSLSSRLRYGDVVVIRNRCQTTDSLPKLGDFDYRQYLARKQIYNTVYLPAYSWKKIGSNAGNPLVSYAIRLREQFLTILSQQGIQGAEYAVASAILLGYSDELTPELRSAYQNSGTMHILCVSGLHVGLFAMVVMNLLFFLKRSRWKLILKALIVLIAIWGYSLITGFSPSVLRAATMFTFITLGQCLERNTSIYNSLAISVIVLLFYDPMMLYSIGFQLSYLAVIGIVLIQKLIIQLWEVENRAIKYFWELTAVSIAAQLATSPLAIYYFHQFPNYFILSNIVASPISVLVIPLGFLILVASPVSTVVAGFFGQALSVVIRVLNKSVSLINGLPLSVWKNLDWSKFEMIMAYCTLGFLLFAISKQRKIPVWSGLACILLMTGSMFFREMNVILSSV